MNFLVKNLLSTFKPIESFLPVQLIIRKFFIIIFLSILLLSTNNSYSSIKNIKDFGIIALMYHRFEENKYPSTNIRIKDFKTHLELIEQEKFIFVNPNNFEQMIKNNKKKKERFF